MRLGNGQSGTQISIDKYNNSDNLFYMTLKEYSDRLVELANKHPNALVVHSKDDEGNGFQPVHYAPTEGNYKDGEFETGVKKVNAVCIN